MVMIVPYMSSVTTQIFQNFAEHFMRIGHECFFSRIWSKNIFSKFPYNSSKNNPKIYLEFSEKLQTNPSDDFCQKMFY